MSNFALLLSAAFTAFMLWLAIFNPEGFAPANPMQMLEAN